MSVNDKKKKIDKAAKDYLDEKKILILDESRQARNTIETALQEFGITPVQITSMKSFAHAKEFILDQKPEIIITDFNIQDNFGLDLMRMQQDYAPEVFDRLFIVVTDTAQDSAVADAAEEEVDCYLLKPVTQDLVVEYLLSAITNKVQPSEYATMISQAKQKINDGQFEEAKKLLIMARLLSQKPTIAHYYMGQILEREGDMSSALQEYRSGLSFNDIHFKCLVGEFSVLNAQNKREEAYNSLRRIASLFPLTPQLLKQALLLAIYTYNYRDVEKYYNLYLKVPRKTPDLKHVVSQGLLTAGKFLLNEKRIEDALDFFKRGSVINGRNPDYLHNIISTLIENKLENDCYTFLQMFEDEDLGGDLHRQLEFKVKSYQMNDETLLREGREMIFNGFGDEYIYTQVLEQLLASEQYKILESIVYKGINELPELREHLLSYMEKAKERQTKSA